MNATSYTVPTNYPNAEPTTYHYAHHRLEAVSTTSAYYPTAEPTTTPASSCEPDTPLLHNSATGPSNYITADSTVSTISCSFYYPT